LKWEALIVANIFREMKKELGILYANLRFSRKPLELELIREKITSIEEILDFAKEYAASVNHQSVSNVGDRLIYYLTEGNLDYNKVANHFGVSPSTVAGNIHYASRACSNMLGDLVNQLTEAEDLESVQACLFEFRQVKKSVTNPYDFPERSLKKAQKKVGIIFNLRKDYTPIIIPSK
jgi:hypothetical protein